MRPPGGRQASPRKNCSARGPTAQRRRDPAAGHLEAGLDPFFEPLRHPEVRRDRPGHSGMGSVQPDRRFEWGSMRRKARMRRWISASPSRPRPGKPAVKTKRPPMPAVLQAARRLEDRVRLVASEHGVARWAHVDPRAPARGQRAEGLAEPCARGRRRSPGPTTQRARRPRAGRGRSPPRGAARRRSRRPGMRPPPARRRTTRSWSSSTTRSAGRAARHRGRRRGARPGAATRAVVQPTRSARPGSSARRRGARSPRRGACAASPGDPRRSDHHLLAPTPGEAGERGPLALGPQRRHQLAERLFARPERHRRPPPPRPGTVPGGRVGCRSAPHDRQLRVHRARGPRDAQRIADVAARANRHAEAEGLAGEAGHAGLRGEIEPAVDDHDRLAEKRRAQVQEAERHHPFALARLVEHDRPAQLQRRNPSSTVNAPSPRNPGRRRTRLSAAASRPKSCGRSAAQPASPGAGRSTPSAKEPRHAKDGPRPSRTSRGDARLSPP